MDRGAWWAPVLGVTKSQTQLSMCRTAAQVRRLIGPYNVPAETPVSVSTESPTENQYRVNTENQDGMLGTERS